MFALLSRNIDLSSFQTPASPLSTPKFNESASPLPQKDKNNDINKSIHESSFKLPLQYLDKNFIHPLSPIVSQDLELVTSTNTPMYDILLKPSHPFAHNIIEKWSSHFTSHIPFLKDSQNVLIDHSKYKEKMSNNTYVVDYNNISNIWKTIKEDPYFLEHYSYMEFDFLKYLNHSSSFLQSLAFIHLISPLTTFLIPILVLIIPFFILKIQGIPINLNKYSEVLMDIAKHHFIGKTMTSLQKLSFTSISYIFITVFFYFLQIYQNFISLIRFYRNICQIKKQLYDLKQYVQYSINCMTHYIDINKNRCYYYEFCKDIYKNSLILKDLNDMLENIHNKDFGLLNINDMGYMLKCYYSLYDNQEYDEALRFSFSFEGYIDNLNGLHENIEKNIVHNATFFSKDDVDTQTLSTPPLLQNEKEEKNSKKSIKNSFNIKKQYYPPASLSLPQEEHIKNDCKLDKNMIITGVNASGKTTFLKTTTINIIFTQQFGFGFYESFKITPYTHIHSYLNIPDTSGRDSLFQAESRRCKEIIDIIGNNKNDLENRHFCIFDELYSGTNPIEATKSAYAFLLYLSGFKNVDFILTTHYTSICKKITEKHKMRNYKMNVKRDEDGKLLYTYKIKEGICRIKGAFEILKSMNYPEEILKNI